MSSPVAPLTLSTAQRSTHQEPQLISEMLFNIATLIPALALLTPALAHFSRPNGNELQNIREKFDNESRGRPNFKPCAGYKTRDNKLCTCLGDTVEPVSWYTHSGPGRRDFDEDAALEKRTFGGKKCGDWPKQECVCPDSPNTWLEFKRNQPVCKCPGDYQREPSFLLSLLCPPLWRQPSPLR